MSTCVHVQVPLVAASTPIVPTAPRDLTVTDITADSITVSWREPETLGDTSVNYTVMVEPMNVGDPKVTITNVSAVISGLNSSTMYTISVTAQNSVGPSPRATVENLTLDRELTSHQV